MTEPPSGYTPPPPTAPPDLAAYAPYQNPAYQNPAYQNQPYQNPAYQYAPYGQLYGNGSPYVPYGYPPYAPYHGYPPYPPALFGRRRPGTATGASVVAFVLAALLMLAGIMLFLDATVVHAIGEEGGFDLGNTTAEFSFDGVLDFVAGAVLVTGGVLLLGGNRNGRTLLFLGVALDLGAAIYWLVRTGSSSSALVFYAVLFATLGVITGSLLAPPGVHRWLRENAEDSADSTGGPDDHATSTSGR